MSVNGRSLRGTASMETFDNKRTYASRNLQQSRIVAPNSDLAPLQNEGVSAGPEMCVVPDSRRLEARLVEDAGETDSYSDQAHDEANERGPSAELGQDEPEDPNRNAGHCHRGSATHHIAENSIRAWQQEPVRAKRTSARSAMPCWHTPAGGGRLRTVGTRQPRFHVARFMRW